MSFQQKRHFIVELKQSHIVLALDFPFHSRIDREHILSKAIAILDLAAPFVCAIQIGHAISIPLGTFDGVQKLIQQAHNKDLQVIMDCKLNGTMATNECIAEYYFDAGFDAITAHPLNGWEEGLKPVFASARKFERGIILQTYMGRKSETAANSYDQIGYEQTIQDIAWGIHSKQYHDYARKALMWKADGAMLGPVEPAKIQETYDILRDNVQIYASDLIEQGWSAKDAINAGATYLVVGNEITNSEDLVEKIKLLRSITQQALIQRYADETAGILLNRIGA
jgi:orotidine-5'-phosphate decarboxylase